MNRRLFLGSLITTLATGCSRRSLELSRPDFGGDLRIAFYTDLHAAPSGTIPDALERAARAIRRSGADLLIGGGDFITEGYTSCPNTLTPRWDLYRHFQHALGQHSYPALGNHDLEAAHPPAGACDQSTDPRAHYREFFGLERTYYSFDVHRHHLIVLDAVSIVDSDLLYWGQVSDEQLHWLARDLEDVSPTTPIILVTHIPLLTSLFQATLGAEAAAPKNRVVTNNTEVLQLFSRHNLRLVLQGHLHVQELLTWRQTTFINGGAICGGWWQGSWQGTPPGFGVVTLRQERIEWEYRTYESA